MNTVIKGRVHAKKRGAVEITTHFFIRGKEQYSDINLSRIFQGLDGQLVRVTIEPLEEA